MGSHRSCRLAATLVVFITLACAPAAQATFPGENGKIAFTRVHANENADIWTINADGSDLTRLTNNEIYGGDSAFDSAPHWSPDGRKILFARQRQTEAESGVFTMNSDGSGLTQLSRFPGSIGWLPGNRVAFTEWGPTEGLYTVNPDGTGRTRVGPNPDTGISWSPDGTMFVSARCCREGTFDEVSMFVSSIDGSEVRELIHVARYEWPYPVWGPGPHIAFLRFLPNGGDDIYTINFDGTAERRVTNDSALELEQKWSPDGTRLLYLSTLNTRPGDVFDVFTIRADGTDVRNLSPGSTTSESNADWSPDGTRVAFTTHDEGAGLFTVDASGMSRTRLTSTFGEEHDGRSDWQPLLRSSFRNAPAFCRVHRAAVGPRQFRVRYGKGNKGGGAFGRCVRGAK